MYFVYIIKSDKDDKNYTGITDNLQRRIRQHNHGSRATISTKNRGPFRLVYYETADNRSEARKREKYLKSGIGREFIKKIIQYSPP